MSESVNRRAERHRVPPAEVGLDDLGHRHMLVWAVGVEEAAGAKRGDARDPGQLPLLARWNLELRQPRRLDTKALT